MTGLKRSDSLSYDLSELIHHAVLTPQIARSKFSQICNEVKNSGLSRLCTDLCGLKVARELFGSDTHMRVFALIAFPFGNLPTVLKKMEIEYALENGADEIEIVPNFSFLEDKNTNRFAEEIADLCSYGVPVRAILNTYNLQKDIIQIAIEALIDAGVRGIQNGNGFGPPVTASEIKMISKIVNSRISIKAVGGIKTLDNVIELIEAGANEIGTSNGISIIKEANKKINGKSK